MVRFGNASLISHGGFDGGMSEELLEFTDVDAALERMNGPPQESHAGGQATE